MEKIPLNRFATITAFTKCNYIAECNEWATGLIDSVTYSGQTDYWKIRFADTTGKVFYLQSSAGSPYGKNLQSIGFADGCTVILQAGTYHDGGFMMNSKAKRILVKPGDHVTIKNDYRDFYNSTNLEEIGEIDCSNANMSGFAAYSIKLRKLHIYGAVNSFSIASTWNMHSMLDHDEILYVIEHLGDVTGTTRTPSLTISAAQNAKLTDAERKIATDKGWTIKLGDA